LDDYKWIEIKKFLNKERKLKDGTTLTLVSNKSKKEVI